MRVVTLFTVLAAVPACILGHGYEDNPDNCRTNQECPSGVCDLATFRCVPIGGADSGGIADGTGTPLGDGPIGYQSEAGQIIDAAIDSSDARTSVPDTWFCALASQCTDPAKAFCVGGACVGCATDQQCQAKDPTLGACHADGRCVQCTANTACSGATPICGATEKCQACAADTECATLNDPARFACAASGACVQCTATNATKCGGATSACDAKLNQCVQCTSAANCAGATPICGTTDKCQACASESDCASIGDAARFACAATGACVQCTLANPAKCTGNTKLCDAKNTCVQCLTSTDCKDAAAPICGTDGKCKACAGEADCLGLKDDARYACAASGACVQCTLANPAKCTGGTPACEIKTNTCVACTSKANCSGTAPICGGDDTCKPCAGEADCSGLGEDLRYACAASGACVQCTLANSAKCTGRTPACEPKTNTCVQCTSPANCSGTTPMCGTDDTCKACGGDTDCAGLGEDLRYACATTGACVQCTATNTTKCTGGTVCNTTINNSNINKCVVCTDNTTCSGNAPICNTSTNTCRKCSGASDCAGFPGQTACAASGACVQCTDNSTCSGATPICNTSTNTCRACTADSECSAIGPGVCMNHQDGRCASTAETIVVSAGGIFPSSPAGKRLVVVRGSVTGTIAWSLSGPQMTIVGQNGAMVTGNGTAATIHVTGGDLYIRDLGVTGGAPGITADGGAVLRLNSVTSSNNPKAGILLNGAAFDLENTTVSSNGTGGLGTTRWGGILVNNPPAGGIRSMNHVTIQNNDQFGLLCSEPITSSNTVLASGNVRGSPDPADQISGCGFISCSGGSGCGAL